MPSFTLGIGSYKAVIPGSYITYSADDNNSKYLRSIVCGCSSPQDADAYRAACFGGIQSSKGLALSVIGGIFLKAQFVVFQSSPLQLGFAPKPL